MMMEGGRMRRPWRWLLAAGVIACVVVAIVALAGSGGAARDAEPTEPVAPSVVQAGAPGEPSRTLSEDDVTKIEPPTYTETDVVFAQGMIHHHAQALEMTGLVPGRTESRDLRLLAERMQIAQEGEIELITRWLKARDEEVPAPSEHAAGH